MAKMLALSRFEFKAMGSPCEFRLYVENVLVAANAIQSIAAEIYRLEEKYSRFKTNNYLYHVNQAAEKGESIVVDEEFLSLLDFADTCYQQSDGLFDITSGALRKVWDFDSTKKPEQILIDEMQSSIGWQYVARKDNRLSFLRKGMQLDFGGIVKEYAVDRAAVICKEHGIHYGLIDMGGDIQVLGPHPTGKPWLIDIRHPRNTQSSFATIALQQGALASSGDYERCIDIDGEKYSHILSPKTGWPIRGLAAVSVVATQCVLAGSACTIAILKEKTGILWLDDLGIDYVAMDIEQNSYQVTAPRMCQIIMQ